MGPLDSNWDSPDDWLGESPYGSTGRYWSSGVPDAPANFYVDMSFQHRRPEPYSNFTPSQGGPFNSNPSFDQVGKMLESAGLPYQQSTLRQSHGESQAWMFTQGKSQSYLHQNSVTGQWYSTSPRNTESEYAIMPSASWQDNKPVVSGVEQILQSAFTHQGSFGQAMQEWKMPNVQALGVAANPAYRAKLGSGMLLNAEHQQRQDLLGGLNQQGYGLTARADGFAFNIDSVYSAAFNSGSDGYDVTGGKIKRLQLETGEPGYPFLGGQQLAFGHESVWRQGQSTPAMSTVMNEVFLSFAPHIAEGSAFANNQLTVARPFNTQVPGQLNLQPGQVYGRGIGGQESAGSIHDLEQMLGRRFGSYSSITVNDVNFKEGNTQASFMMHTNLMSAKTGVGKAGVIGVDPSALPDIQTPWGQTRADIVRPWDPAQTNKIAEAMFKALPSDQRQVQWNRYIRNSDLDIQSKADAYEAWNGRGAIPTQWQGMAQNMMTDWAMSNRMQQVNIGGQIVGGDEYQMMLQHNKGLFDPSQTKALSGNRFQLPDIRVPALVGPTTDSLRPEWSRGTMNVGPDSLRMIYDAQPDLYNTITKQYGPNQNALETVLAHEANSNPKALKQLGQQFGVHDIDRDLLNKIQADALSANPDMTPGQLQRSVLEGYGAQRPGAINIGGKILPSASSMSRMAVYNDDEESELINNLASSGLRAMHSGDATEALGHLGTMANSKSTLEQAAGIEVPGGSNFLFAHSAVPEGAAVTDLATMRRIYGGKSEGELRDLYDSGKLSVASMRYPHADPGRPIQSVSRGEVWEWMSQDLQNQIPYPAGRTFHPPQTAFASQGDSDMDRILELAAPGVKPSDAAAQREYYQNAAESESVKRSERFAGEMDPTAFLAAARQQTRMTTDQIAGKYHEEEFLAKSSIGPAYSMFQRGLSPTAAAIGRQRGDSSGRMAAISASAGQFGMALSQGFLDRSAGGDEEAQKLMRMNTVRRNKLGGYGVMENDEYNLLASNPGEMTQRAMSAAALTGSDLYKKDPDAWRNQIGRHAAMMLTPRDDIGNPDREAAVMSAVERMQGGAAFGDVQGDLFGEGRDIGMSGIQGRVGSMSPLMEYLGGVAETDKADTPEGTAGAASAAGMARSFKQNAAHPTSIDAAVGVNHPVMERFARMIGRVPGADERRLGKFHAISERANQGFIPRRSERRFMEAMYNSDNFDTGDLFPSGRGTLGGGRTGSGAGAGTGGGGGGDQPPGIVAGADPDSGDNGSSGGGTGRSSGGRSNFFESKPLGHGELFTLKSDSAFLREFRETAEHLAKTLPDVNKAEKEHIDQLKTMVKVMDRVEKTGGKLAGRAGAGYDLGVEEREGLAAFNATRGMSDTMDDLREQTLRVGRGQLKADDGYQPSMLEIMTKRGKAGRKMRDEEFGEGGEHERMGGMVGRENLEMMAGVAGAGAHALSAGSLFRIRTSQSMFIRPAFNAMNQYMDQQSSQEQMAVQSGMMSYGDAMGGITGQMMRRQTGMQEAQLAYGQQAYNAYSPLMDAFLGKNQTGGIGGAIAGIGGPAIGAGLMASVASPMVGLGVGLGAAGLGMLGYAGTASTNVGDIGAYRNQSSRAGGDLGGRVGAFFGNFSGAVGSATLNLKESLGILNDEDRKILESSQGASSMMDQFSLGNASKGDMESFARSSGLAPGKLIGGGIDRFLSNYAASDGWSRESQMPMLAFNMRYSGGQMPGVGQFMQQMGLVNSGYNIPGIASSVAGASGVDINDSARMSQLINQTTQFGAAAGQQGQNVSMIGGQLESLGQEFAGVNMSRRLAGQGQISPFAMALNSSYNTNPTARAALSNLFGTSAGIGSQDFYSQVGQGFEQGVEGLIKQGDYATAGQRTGRMGDMYSMFQRGQTAGADMSVMNPLIQQFGALSGKDFAQVSAAAGGDRFALSSLGQRSGNLSLQTVDTQTGMSPTYFGMSKPWYDKLSSEQGSLFGLSYNEAMGGERGIQDTMRINARNMETLQFQNQQYSRGISFQSMTGGGRVGAEGWAKGGDGLAGLSSIFEAQGMKLDAGNGMGMWQIQDATEVMQREKQVWSMSQQTKGVDFQQRNLDLNAKQFYEKWDMNWNQFQTKSSQQSWSMNFGRMQQQTQQGWQAEDMALDENRSDLNFGWQMEDFDRNIRFSRGRQRMDLQRGQERAVISHGLDETQRERGKDRFDQEKKWSQELFEVNKKNFDTNKRMSEDEMNMQKRHFQERQGLEKEQFELTKENHEKEKVWMTQQWKLEDQRRLVERQVAVVQQNMQDRLAITTREVEVSTNRYRDALDAIQREYNENNGAINAATNNLNAFRAAMMAIANAGVPHASGGYSSGGGGGGGSIGAHAMSVTSRSAEANELSKQTTLLQQLVEGVRDGLINATIYAGNTEVKGKDLYTAARGKVN